MPADASVDGPTSDAILVDASTQAVRPADFGTCAPRGSFDDSTFIRLRDPDRRLGFPLVADGTVYPGMPSNGGAAIAVDPLVKAQRLLTGGDIDIESMVVDAMAISGSAKSSARSW
ncbi:hypothetical protein ACFX58_09200 [Sphingomonas sp. NCPPB 2930]